MEISSEEIDRIHDAIGDLSTAIIIILIVIIIYTIMQLTMFCMRAVLTKEESLKVIQSESKKTFSPKIVYERPPVQVSEKTINERSERTINASPRKSVKKLDRIRPNKQLSLVISVSQKQDEIAETDDGKDFHYIKEKKSNLIRVPEGIDERSLKVLKSRISKAKECDRTQNDSFDVILPIKKTDVAKDSSLISSKMALKNNEKSKDYAEVRVSIESLEDITKKNLEREKGYKYPEKDSFIEGKGNDHKIVENKSLYIQPNSCLTPTEAKESSSQEKSQKVEVRRTEPQINASEDQQQEIIRRLNKPHSTHINIESNFSQPVAKDSLMFASDVALVPTLVKNDNLSSENTRQSETSSQNEPATAKRKEIFVALSESESSRVSTRS